MSDKDRKKRRAGSTDMDLIEKKMSELGSGTYFTPKEGKNVIRILPPWNDEGLFYFETTLHYGLRHEGRQRAFPCLGRDDCPICDYIKELEKGGEEDEKLSKRMRPRTKFYVNIIDVRTGKVQIWGFSRKTLSTILGFMSDPDWGDITHPKKGFNLVVERTGMGLETKYEIRVKQKPTEIEVDDWEDQLHELDKVVVDEMDADKLEDIIDENFGKGAKKKAKVDDDDDDDKPRKKKEDDDDDRKEEVEFEEGDKVIFEDEDGKEQTGKIVDIDKKEGEATVEDEDEEEYTVDLEDLQPAKSKKKSSKEDDEDDDKGKESAADKRSRRRQERKEKRKKRKK